MDRFGSSRLRIVWTLVALLLAGILLGGLSRSADNAVTAFGTPIPLATEDLTAYTADNLARVAHTMASAIILFAGFFPLSDWMAAGQAKDRYAGLFLGIALAFLHGLFLSQVALFPVWAACAKLTGSPFQRSVLNGDLSGMVLGLQLLLWAALLARVVASNRGVALMLAFLMQGLGELVAYVGQFAPMLGLSDRAGEILTYGSHFFPVQGLPADGPAWSALPLALGGPAVLLAILLAFPGKGRKG
ncbi:MAG: hypothetical protein U0P81_09180 [Holophagaceae bacterium]